MPRFSINVSMMLTEHAFLDRFQAAADLGFAGVDIQFPYEHSAGSIAARAAAAGVEVVLVNLPAGDLPAGGCGLAARPGAEQAFREGAALARRYCLETGCRRVNVLAGRAPPGTAERECLETLVRNLRWVAGAFADDGITVLVEPVNGVDQPGFLVQTTAAALTLIERAGGLGDLAIQYDLYHRQIAEGNLIGGLEQFLPRIGHIQFADAPGRHEPGTGAIDFGKAFAAIDALGYAGWVGAEYRPSTTTAASLGWFRR